jgi:hypothetical protein
MREGAELLDDLGVNWWLSAGTLLGAYRDGLSDEFLLRDTDIDIGVEGSGKFDSIMLVFTRAGFSPFRHYDMGGKWAQLCFKKDDVLFDIYFFNRDGESLINHNEHGYMVKPCDLFDYHTLMIGGYEYPVPECERYLEIRYGKDWMIPKGKEGWESQAANLVR